MLSQEVLCKNVLALFKTNMHVRPKNTPYHMELLGWAAGSKLNKNKDK